MLILNQMSTLPSLPSERVDTLLDNFSLKMISFMDMVAHKLGKLSPCHGTTKALSDDLCVYSWPISKAVVFSLAFIT